MQRRLATALCFLAGGLLASWDSPPAASPEQVHAQARAQAASALASSSDSTNTVLVTFSQQASACSSNQCAQAAAAKARDAMAKIISTFHAHFGPYTGEHYTVFVHSTALSYLRGDFATLTDTYFPAFTYVIRNAAVPHTAQFRTSGARLSAILGAHVTTASLSTEERQHSRTLGGRGGTTEPGS